MSIGPMHCPNCSNREVEVAVKEGKLRVVQSALRELVTNQDGGSQSTSSLCAKMEDILFFLDEPTAYAMARTAVRSGEPLKTREVWERWPEWKWRALERLMTTEKP